MAVPPFEGADRLWLEKIENLLVVNLDRKRRNTVVAGKPYVLHIEPFNGCNLRCAECMQTLWAGMYPPGRMTLDMFKTIMAEYGETAISLRLYNYGEPLLNRDVYDMVRIARCYKINTVISSNMNVADPEALVDCGLDVLIMSIDGATQEIYEIYRRGGSLERVLKNVKAVVAEKRRRKTKSPFLIWQFLNFEHNHHELGVARKLAKRLGVDHFYTGVPQICNPESSLRAWCGHTETGTPVDSFPAENVSSESNSLPDVCNWLWTGMSVTATGDVFPCCVMFTPETSFDNIQNKKDISGLFNCKRFVQVREFFTKHQPFPQGEDQRMEGRFCSYCNDSIHHSSLLHCESCVFYAGTYVVDAAAITSALRSICGIPDDYMSARIGEFHRPVSEISEAAMVELLDRVRDMKRGNLKAAGLETPLWRRLLRFLHW
jgi:sulfatase maturation enzyme AslB (radical SAM superfamily)